MKKDKPMEQLQNFEKIKLSDDEKSGKSLNSRDSSKVNLSKDISDWSSILSYTVVRLRRISIVEDK